MKRQQRPDEINRSSARGIDDVPLPCNGEAFAEKALRVRLTRQLGQFVRSRVGVAVLSSIFSVLIYASVSSVVLGEHRQIPVSGFLPGEVDLNHPALFIGGCPRSGTTLMRVMLDAHPEILCGEETRVIPDILFMARKWRKKGREHLRVLAAGVSDSLIDDSLRSFIWNVLHRHWRSAEEATSMLCAKDPFTLAHLLYVAELFPRSKFIVMIRDGRAVADSIIRRKISISTISNQSSFEDILHFWGKTTRQMVWDCKQLGGKRCMMVHYESLVLNSEEVIREVLHFLALPWSGQVLRHEELLSEGKIRISKMEPSSNQVSKARYKSSIDGWRNTVPHRILLNAHKVAPLLTELGYK